MPSYNDDVHEQAFKLYCAHVGNCQAVSRHMHIGQNTIYSWRDKYGWDDRIAAIDARTDNEIEEVTKEIKLETLKDRKNALQTMVNSIWKRIDSGEIKPTAQILVGLFDQLHKVAGDYAPERIEMLQGIKIIVEPSLTSEQEYSRDMEDIKRLHKKYGELCKFYDE